MFVVYKIVNKITLDYYIGVHKTSNPQDSYLGSGNRIKKAVKVYGMENFKKEILFLFSSRLEAYHKERELVEPLLEDPKCLNLHVGGNGGFQFINKNNIHNMLPALEALRKKQEDPEENKRLKAAQLLGRLNSPKWRKSMKDQTHTGFLGKKHSEETITKMKEKAVGRNKGETNPNFGTCWIMENQTGQSIRIKKEEFSKWELKGWAKGRKLRGLG